MNLEDKILGEKLNYYCSSSEEENNNSDNEDDVKASEPQASAAAAAAASTFESNATHWTGNSANTGPKGVIKDWQRFKQLETEKRQDQEKEKLELIKKLSITAKTTEEDKKSQEQAEFDEELNELLNDDFLLEFQKKRMQEMLEMSGLLRKFGEIHTLMSGDDFLKAIDGEQKNVTIVIHIYEEKYRACKTMNNCLKTLAQEYPSVKFCKILSTVTGLSKNFKTKALPTLLVYKNGQIIGNFIRLHEELGGDEFFSSDVESFLIENSLLPDKTLYPPIGSVKSQSNDNDDSD